MKIGGVEVDTITREQFAELLQRWINDSEKVHVVTINPEFIVEAQRNEEFRSVLNGASARLVDGVGIAIAVHYLSKKIGYSGLLREILLGLQLVWSCVEVMVLKKRVCYDGQPVERVTGTDVVQSLPEYAWMNGKKVLLVGGFEDVAEEAMRVLSKRNSQIVYKAMNGHLNVRNASSAENDAIVSEINRFAPDILLVAYGHPYQDIWIAHNRERLQFKVAMGVGGAFDYIAGRVSRAPEWMRAIGLEWLYRLIRQPERLPRIVNATLVFMQLLYRQKRSTMS